MLKFVFLHLTRFHFLSDLFVFLSRLFSLFVTRYSFFTTVVCYFLFAFTFVILFFACQLSLSVKYKGNRIARTVHAVRLPRVPSGEHTTRQYCKRKSGTYQRLWHRMENGGGRDSVSIPPDDLRTRSPTRPLTSYTSFERRNKRIYWIKILPIGSIHRFRM